MLAKFGQYIINEYFRNDNKGEEVSLIINEAFIKSFCALNKFEIKSFFGSINLWSIHKSSPIQKIIGFIGIQLYAVTYMENSDGFTDKNYRVRLCDRDILNIELNDWQSWAKEYQDIIWQKFYKWCASEGYEIEKCEEKTGWGRYVQYPINHGSMMFRQEDLSKIAGLFVHRGLKPGEDITEREFYKLLWPDYYPGRYYSFSGSYYTLRSRFILSADIPRGLRQIFHYYLRWDGTYLEQNRLLANACDKYQLYLFNENGQWSIDIIQVENGKCQTSINFDNKFSFSKLRKYFKEKYPSFILFKRHTDYEDYWEETRFIPDKNENGIAILPSSERLKYDKKDILCSEGRYVIVKVHSDSIYYFKYFAEDRPFRIVGGLKIDSNTYLLKCLPYIECLKPISFWIDGELQTIEEKCRLLLDLDEGEHIIKFKNYRQINLNVIHPQVVYGQSRSDNGWQLCKDKKHPLWDYNYNSNGKILGLDFSEYAKHEEEKLIKSKTKKWIEDILYEMN